MKVILLGIKLLRRNKCICCFRFLLKHFLAFFKYIVYYSPQLQGLSNIVGIPNSFHKVFIVLFLSSICLEVYGENKMLFKSYSACSTIFFDVYLCQYMGLSGSYFFIIYNIPQIDRTAQFIHCFVDTLGLFSSLLKQYCKEYPYCVCLNLQEFLWHVCLAGSGWIKGSMYP